MPRSDRQPTRTHNVALLSGAFAVSQGAVFVVQSWLVAHDQVILVGLFGSLFTFATLALSIIDWGGVVVLARQELSKPSDAVGDVFFWALCTVRAIVALCLGAMAGAAYLLNSTEFSGNYALAAVPGLLLGSVNLGGLLDGARRSGVSGATASAPALVSAFALIFVPDLPPPMQGLVLGCAFSFGVTLSVGLQALVLGHIGRLPAYNRPTLPATVDACRQGGLVLLTLLPSYVSYRIQVAIAAWLLGPSDTGLFVYAKQIINGLQQGVAFIRRAEFPSLISSFRVEATLKAMLRFQRAGLVAGLVASVAVAVVGVLMALMLDGHLGAAGTLLACFGPSVITAATYGAINQAYVADGRAGITAAVTNLNLLLLVGLATLLVVSLGPVGFAVAECLVNVVGIVALSMLWRREPKG